MQTTIDMAYNWNDRSQLEVPKGIALVKTSISSFYVSSITTLYLAWLGTVFSWSESRPTSMHGFKEVGWR